MNSLNTIIICNIIEDHHKSLIATSNYFEAGKWFRDFVMKSFILKTLYFL